VENLPKGTVDLTVKHPFTGKESTVSVSLLSKLEQKKKKKGTRCVDAHSECLDHSRYVIFY
jgi:hypothetical protein